MRIKFVDLNKHMFEGSKCIGFSIRIGEEFFNITKVKQESKVWQIRSCNELNLFNIQFELPKHDFSLVMIAGLALHHLGEYLLQRIKLEQSLFVSISELIGGEEK